MREIPITVPNGTSGAYRVETFVVSEEESKYTRLREACGHPGAYVPPGTYKRLVYGSGIFQEVVMSNTPMEIDTNGPILHAARGNVLIHGLGLGMVLAAILSLNHRHTVDHVTVIEKSPDVLALVAPTYSSDPRVEIIEGDALTWAAAPGARWDCAWHDIWNTICADNLPAMRRLHRRFAQRCDWQGSWCRAECERQARRGR